MAKADYQRMAGFAKVEDFKAYLEERGIGLEADSEVKLGDESPLRQSMMLGDRKIGNRWTAHAMEGWDSTPEGGATPNMIRRWKKFGESGAKIIWGGEAMAVREDGRSNPYQLMINDSTLSDLAMLRQTVIDEHASRYGNTDDLLIGFQLTHSGRFSKPHDNKKPEPRVAYRHPILDRRSGVTSDAQVMTDNDCKKLVDDYVAAAKVAKKAGADFVDVKHCHGYLLHEFLSAYTREGQYGGSFENRTRMLREIVAGIRAEVPGMLIGVRLSAFDWVPFRPNPEETVGNKLGRGIPEDYSEFMPYVYAFGVNKDNPIEGDLSETMQFMELLESLDIRLVNLSAGSPYYNPHIQRPALFPPSDGYQPPEDPLIGVARQINAVKELKQKFPGIIMIGSGYTYLQDYLPHVAQYYVENGFVDSVGLGRMLLPYPELLEDATTKGELDRCRICRTISDCTTAPRKGLVSGCYPLDEYYKKCPEAAKLKELKRK